MEHTKTVVVDKTISLALSIPWRISEYQFITTTRTSLQSHLILVQAFLFFVFCILIMLVEIAYISLYQRPNGCKITTNNSLSLSGVPMNTFLGKWRMALCIKLNHSR